MTSEMAVVASPWKPITPSGAGRGMSSRMACAGSVMASLREFEEKPGAARAGDGGGQRPVREHDVETGQREPLEPGVGELRREAIALTDGVEEIGQRDAGGDGLRPAEQDEAADQEPDDQRTEKTAEEEERQRAWAGADEVDPERPAADHRHQREDH